MGPPEPIVRRVGWHGGAVWLDAPDARADAGFHASAPGEVGFVGVSEAAWALPIGGYQPARRWLRDRRDHPLSAAERLEYRRLLAALEATLDVMRRIEAAVDAHGGLPDAFG